jgi:hypothetical protein
LALAVLAYVAFVMPETQGKSLPRSPADASAVGENSNNLSAPLLIHSGQALLSGASHSVEPDTTAIVDSSSSPLAVDQAGASAILSTDGPSMSGRMTLNPCTLLRVAFRSSVYRRLALILFFSQLSQNGVHSCAQLFLKHHMDYTKNQNNYLLLIMGGWSVGLMLFVIPLLMNRWEYRRIILLGLIADMCHLSLYMYLPSFSYFGFIAFFQGLSYVSFPAACAALARCGDDASGSGSPSEQGLVMAMSASVRSLTQAIAPLAFNGVLSYFTWKGAVVQLDIAPFIVGELCVLAALIATFGLKSEPEPQLPAVDANLINSPWPQRQDGSSVVAQ